MAAGVVLAEAGKRGGEQRIMRGLSNRHDEILCSIVNIESESQCNVLDHSRSL